MTRKQDLEQRLDDLEAALEPTDPAIVIVDAAGEWTVAGDQVDPETAEPSLLLHLRARETHEIDPKTLEIVGCKPRDRDADAAAADADDGGDD